MTSSDWSPYITFRSPSGRDDEERMIDFVNEHFVPFEPLNKAINVCPAGYRMPFFDNLVRKYIAEGLSLMALDDRTGQLMAVAIYTECKKSSDPCQSGGGNRAVTKSGPDGSKDYRALDYPEGAPVRWEATPAKFSQILQLLDQLSNRVNVYTHYEVERYVEMFILCTHSTQRYPGLGSDMAVKSLDMLKTKGFSLCATEATSFYSQKIFDRLGFETLAELHFEDFQPEGEVLFRKHGPHESVKLMTKTF